MRHPVRPARGTVATTSATTSATTRAAAPAVARAVARAVAHLLISTGVLGALVAPAHAQTSRRVTADLGGATLAQAAVPRVTAPTLGGAWRLQSPDGVLDVSGAATLASADRWAAQAVLVGAHTLGDRRQWEVGGVATALRFRGAAPASHLLALARRRLDREAGWGLWAGLGGGFLTRRGTFAPIAAGDAGLWWRARGPTFSLALAAQRARLDTLGGPAAVVAPFGVAGSALAATAAFPAGKPDVAFAFDGGRVRPVLALDLTAAAEWRARRGELAVSAGVRRAAAQFDGVRPILLGSGVLWTGPHLGVTASASDQVADPLRGMPSFRHVAVGVRWRLAPEPGRRVPRTAPGEPARPTPAATPAPGPVAAPTAIAPSVEVVPVGEGAQLRVAAPVGARRVEVRGDWTGWRPVALVAHGDGWALDGAVPRGTRRLVVRVDGGAWQVPANLAGADDDFGSRVGLLIVP